MINDQIILSKISNPTTKEEGFRLLLKAYQERLYWHVRRMVEYHDDAHDVLQNTMIKVYKSIERFEGKSKLYTWLYRIATNECLTFLSKRSKKSMSSLDDELEHVGRTLKADSYFDGNEAQLRLNQAIYTLPEKQKAVFNMRYFDALSYRDMSEILGVTEGGLKASYHHAVKKIEAFIKKGNYE